MNHWSVWTGGLKNNLDVPLLSVFLNRRKLLILTLPYRSVTRIELHTLIFHSLLVLFVSPFEEFLESFEVLFRSFPLLFIFII